MKRREFLKNVGLASAATLLPFNSGKAEDITSMVSDGNPDIVAMMGGSPGEMLKKAIDQVGGIKKYVKKGDKVVLKPNAAWDKSPEQGANTNPEVVATMISLCLGAGAKEVLVFDHTCDNQQSSYKNSGIEDAVKKAGGKMIPGNDEALYKDVELPKGVSLKKAKIHQSLIDCDVWFNMPVLKNHGGTKVTVSMKNLMGIVWDRRAFHQNNLHQCIADIATFSKQPALTIVDAYRTLINNGPQGRTLDDVVETKALFLSKDMVAVDTAAIKFFTQVKDLNMDDVQYLAMARDLKVGRMDLDNLNIKRIKM
ncbi:MAG: DUF362 domain-containing protein [Bacteroidales bacterium]|nr:DUF362 domain-containing protein [Bacteroidales bacterium]